MDEYLRIEILKSIRFKDFKKTSDKTYMSEVVVKALKESTDVDVRSYSAMALINFISEPLVLESLEEVVLNEAEDEDLRYNALDSLVSNIENEPVRKSLLKISMLGDDVGGEAKSSLN